MLFKLQAKTLQPYGRLNPKSCLRELTRFCRIIQLLKSNFCTFVFAAEQYCNTNGFSFPQEKYKRISQPYSVQNPSQVDDE